MFYSPAKERWLAVMQDGEVDQIKINHKQIFTITNCEKFFLPQGKRSKTTLTNFYTYGNF